MAVLIAPLLAGARILAPKIAKGAVTTATENIAKIAKPVGEHALRETCTKADVKPDRLAQVAKPVTAPAAPPQPTPASAPR
jgi:hypothetical protein